MKVRRNRQALALTIAIGMFAPFGVPSARADIWGGDVVVLTQILVNALEQLAQLRQILSAGQDTLSLMQEINQGINDSLSLIRTIDPNQDPGIYRDWTQIQDALRSLETIYGIVVSSRNERVQRDTDQSIAEAVTLNNSLYDYTRQIDDVGQQIESASHFVSPGGAQKLTAQSLGVVLHVMNASLRAQATGLKLNAQALAVQNRKDKEETQRSLETAKDLSNAMSAQNTSFTLPRF